MLWLRTYWPAIAVLAVSAAAGAYVGWRHGFGWGVVFGALVLLGLAKSLTGAEDYGRRDERERNGGR